MEARTKHQRHKPILKKCCNWVVVYRNRNNYVKILQSGETFLG